MPAGHGQVLQLGRARQRQDHGAHGLVGHVRPGKHVPRLSSVAQRVLAQSVSASAAERNWSVYGIMTPARSCMQHQRGDKLVYCHEALHLRAKLQRAAYVQKAVKWECGTV